MTVRTVIGGKRGRGKYPRKLSGGLYDRFRALTKHDKR